MSGKKEKEKIQMKFKRKVKISPWILKIKLQSHHKEITKWNQKVIQDQLIIIRMKFKI